MKKVTGSKWSNAVAVNKATFAIMISLWIIGNGSYVFDAIINLQLTKELRTPTFKNNNAL